MKNKYYSLGERLATYSDLEEYVAEHTTEQYVTMPEPSVSDAGTIIQYVGDDTQDYDKGHFYECVEDPANPGTYIWQEMSVSDTRIKHIIDAFFDDDEGTYIISAEDVNYILNTADTKTEEIWLRIVDRELFYERTVPVDVIAVMSSGNPFIYVVSRVWPGDLGDIYWSSYPMWVIGELRFDTPSVLDIHQFEITDNKASSLNQGGYIDHKHYPTTSAVKNYVDTSIASAMSAAIKREIVQELPVSDIKTDTIYMVPKTEPGSQDTYDEYMYINNAWEKIGSTDIDLSDYATKEYVEEHSITHYEEMPTPGADNVGEVIQYTGEDSGEFEKGHFYEVIETEVSGVTTYEYKEVVLGDGACHLPATVLRIEATDDSATIIAKLGGAENAAAVIDAIENERMIIGLDDYSGLYGNIPVFVTSQIMNDVRHIFLECTTQSDLRRPVYTQKWLTYVNGTWTCLSATNKELAYYEDAAGYSTMPTADSTNLGQVVQYVGNTTNEYTTGHFYEVVEKEVSGIVTYEWREIGTQTYSADASDPEALGSVLSELDPDAVSTIYVENFGPNGDYNGYIAAQPASENSITYTYLTDSGKIVTGSLGVEEDIETGELIVNYGEETVSSFDTTVRQARGWHLTDDSTPFGNNHAVYEDCQWIMDNWAKVENYATPNFQVDGYNLVYLSQYNSSQASDFKQYYAVFTKLYGTNNYYYQVYFYTHYNTTEIYDETTSRKAYKYGRNAVSFLTSHQSLDNYLAKNNTASFTPSGDYNPATKKYVDDTAAAAAEQAIEEASIQVDTMPTPSAENVGEVYQYTGPDTQDLDHGHFYEIVEKEVSGVVTYEYQDIGITVGVTTAVAPQEITDITYGAYRRYPGYSETGLQLLQNNNGQLIWGQTVNSIWIGTQQEYDDLPEHFDTMIYFIKEDE